MIGFLFANVPLKLYKLVCYSTIILIHKIRTWALRQINCYSSSVYDKSKHEQNMKVMINMGIVIVDICSANIITSIDIEEILEREFAEVAVIMNSCPSVCGLCANAAYANVNGKMVHGKTPEECLEKIRLQIKKELAVYM